MRSTTLRPRSLLAAGAALLLSLGCAHSNLARMQSPDDSDREKELKKVQTVGDVTEVSNSEPIPVSGLGLVTGLRGTGGKPPNGAIRSMVEEMLTKRNVPNVKALLESPNTSIVIVAGFIPAGANKGDTFDLEVTLPEQSKTRSLQGGYLQVCELFNYESAKKFDPKMASEKWLKGHPLARAEGAVLTGFGEGEGAQNLKRGRIWGGGSVKQTRPLVLVLKPEHQKAVMAQLIGDRINDTMQGTISGPLNELATAKTNQVIYLRVPLQYKLNMPHYLRVVRLIPLRDSAEARGPYVKRLNEDLLDPRYTITAALRLEALGTQSVPGLKEALKNEHALVRFSAAQSLAYLGESCCGEVLAQMVEQQPSLRAYALTALASFDETVSHVKLRELMNSRSTEARYGAFRALRALDENEPNVQGEHYNDSFWVHRVAPRSQPLVHVSFSRRPEVVLFGDGVQLQPGFGFEAGEFTVTSAPDDDHCTIRRFTNRQASAPRQCPLNLYDILRTLGEMGAMYPDVVELLRQAQTGERLTCQLAVDAVPQRTSEYALALNGASDPDFKQDRDEILSAEADLPPTPTLFERGGKPSRTALLRAEEQALREPAAGGDTRTAARKPLE